MDPVAEIKKLYYGATKATIKRDVDRAIDLLKTLPSEEERERAAVYMDGLSQMRSEWAAGRYAEVAAGATLFRAAWRSASGTFRSVESFFTSLSVRRFIRFIDSATGVLEFFTRLSTTE